MARISRSVSGDKLLCPPARVFVPAPEAAIVNVRHQIGPLDRHRLHDLAAQSEADGVAARYAEMRQQAEAILRELRYRVTVVRLATSSGAAAVENDGPEAFRQKWHDADVPSGRRPPGSRSEQHRLAAALLFVVDFQISQLGDSHFKSNQLRNV